MPKEDGAARARNTPARVSRITGIGSALRDEMPSSTPDEALHAVDRDLLSHLEERFSTIAGPDRRISVAELAKALRIQSEDLARRVLVALDRDRDGDIDIDDFMGSLRRLLLGSTRDRLLFAFRVHDLDGDSWLSRKELETMIALGLSEDALAHPAGEPARLAALVLRRADRDRDDRLSFDEFGAVIAEDAETLRQVTTSGACWVCPNEDLLGRDRVKRPLAVEVARYVQNHAPQMVFLAAWLVANVVLFEIARERYAHAGSNAFIQIARGCGACLNLNAFLVLLPTLRGLLTFVQSTRLSRLMPLGNALPFHRLVSKTLFGLAVVHGIAHAANCYVSDRSSSVFAQLIAPGPRLTGLLWLAVFALMFAGALQTVRRKSFDAFYLTHLLFPVWFAVGLFHAKSFAAWVTVPLLAFAIERTIRYVRRVSSVEVLEMRPLRSGVTRVTLQKPEGFSAPAGAFVFLRVPAVAAHEWHPFTISSAPERTDLTLHVRVLGDFTAALRKLAEDRCKQSDKSPLRAEIDGPYGAPAVGVFDSRRAVLIAGGIGVTPFASVLESIVHRRAHSPDSLKLERVDFYWLNRDQHSFEWFVELLARLTARDQSGLIHVHVFMTGGHGDAACAALNLATRIARSEGDLDLVTGLSVQTHMGDPAWDEEFDVIQTHAREAPVDVYFCGPDGLGNKVYEVCARRGLSFRREIF